MPHTRTVNDRAIRQPLHVFVLPVKTKIRIAAANDAMRLRRIALRGQLALGR